MKRNYTLTLFSGLFIAGTVLAQEAPLITWQRSLGGTKTETLNSMKQTQDGGLILIGQTNSNNGHVSGNKGSNDIWVTKINANGAIDWQKSIGGSLSDNGSDVIETTDGGYLIVGQVYSNNGDVSGAGYLGASDAWAAKLDYYGNIEWKKCYGDYQHDRFYSVKQTADGGFIMAGSTTSNHPDLMNDYRGDHDGWILKTDALGNVMWHNVYGGSSYDVFSKIVPSPDGGYIVSGYTKSQTLDLVTQTLGELDAWVIKIDIYGNLFWETTFGGALNEEAHDVLVNSGGKILVVGHTFSNTGNFPINKGNTDLFVSMLSADGQVEWSKTYGGNEYDFGKGICTHGSGYLIIGSTNSNNGDVTGKLGGQDVWLIKVDQQGDLLWRECLGGSLTDGGKEIQTTPDGGFVFAGSSTSSNGHLTNNYGQTDYWIAKGVFLNLVDITEGTTGINPIAIIENEMSLYPNPVKDVVFVNVKEKTSMSIIDLQGKVLFSQALNAGSNTVSVNHLASGIYLIHTTDGSVKRMIKN